MLSAELQNIVQLHKEWLLSGGESGQQASLENADLRQVDLQNVDLSYAVLTGANLDRANLTGAKLVNADLRKCTLAYANLRQSDLSNANLSRSRAQGADFTEARLNKSQLEQMQLDNACLRKADLTGAQARRARFNRADLSRAVLDGCCAEQAQFRQTNLTHSSLRQAVMHGANLFGAKVVGVNFEKSVIDNITADAGLILCNEETLSEKDKLNARRIKNARSVQLILKIIGFSAIGTAVLAMAMETIAGLVDVTLMFSKQTFSSQTGFAYAQWILVTAGLTTLGVLMLVARLRLDVIALSPMEMETVKVSNPMEDSPEASSIVLENPELKVSEVHQG
jgi:uncharacterized protein YjbI with pentapeptide repeats